MEEMAAALSAGYRPLEEEPADQLDFQDSSSFRDDEGYPNPRVQSGGSHARRIMRFSKERGCSKRSAVMLLCLVMLSIFMIAVIASLARPQCIPPPIVVETSSSTSMTSGGTTPTTTTTAYIDTTSPTKAPTVTTKSPAIATNGERFPWTDIRLPETTKPVHYELDIITNLSNFQVTGSVKIKFRCNIGVNSIIMHSKNMDRITPPERLQTPVGSAPAVTKMLIYEAHEQVYFEFNTALKPATNYSITISFSYELSDTLAGYYRSSYMENGGKRFLATTQFEPTAARQAFPCFDEPQLKATFSMKMTRDKTLLSLFNTELLSTTTIDDDTEQDVFKTTVQMSTYLVAFVVCDFAKISNTTSSGTAISVYTNPDKIDQAQLALDVLQKTIPFYETFFGVSYPLSKQDMIAIPDFSAGAMENWGLITYREASILYQEGVTSSGRKEWIVQTITHELAHQWFGNLVTMEWWNDLWLNEGFASFVMFLGSDNYNKEWKMMDQFTVFTTQNALWVDSHGNSHPISVTVKDPSEINAIFDSISYDKGSAIIRMLKDYLPDKVFQKGLQSYLKKFKFSNANTNDLWNSIEKANDGAVGSLSDMMDTWTLQMGYPVVNLTRKGSQVCATQEHFLHSPNVQPSPDFPSPYNYQWTIPLTFFTSDAVSVKKTKLMDKDQAEVRFDLGGNVKWIKANMNQSGFYRVNYDDDNWNALINQLNEDHTQLTAADRANLVDDAFSLAWADKLRHSIPLEMSLYLVKEQDYGPVSAAISNLDKIGSVMRSTRGYSSFVAYMLKLLAPQIDHFNQTGWDTEVSHLEGFLKTTVLSTAVHLEHAETVEYTKNLFKEWKELGTLVSADLRSIVYCSGIVHGTRDDWDFCWKKYNSTLAASEKTVLLRALSCTYDPFLINRYLHWSLDEDKIPSQNTGTVIAGVAGNPAGAHAALTFVIENWDVLIQRYENSPFEIGHIIKSVTSRISRQFEYDQASQYFITHFNDTKTGKRAVQQALENMQSNIQWLSAHEEEVTNWFKGSTGS